jgi:hypothetical protein
VLKPDVLKPDVLKHVVVTGLLGVLQAGP